MVNNIQQSSYNQFLIAFLTLYNIPGFSTGLIIHVHCTWPRAKVHVHVYFIDTENMQCLFPVAMKYTLAMEWLWVFESWWELEDSSTALTFDLLRNKITQDQGQPIFLIYSFMYSSCRACYQKPYFIPPSFPVIHVDIHKCILCCYCYYYFTNTIKNYHSLHWAAILNCF